MARVWRFRGMLAVAYFSAAQAGAAENVSLVDVPDYAWHAGCFGTAAANLIGYWDRHGLPEMYVGPTAGGEAPLTSFGANAGIKSLWASQAGLDGRPAGKPGHIDDYWEYFGVVSSFESTAPDPYVAAGRAEHAADCLGDFIGQSQRKFQDLNGECSGNIDGFAFTYWDKAGGKLANFQPPLVSGVAVRDIPSGLRAWSQYRGYGAGVVSQLSDFNSTVAAGRGFTFAELKAEIDAGFPVLLILQEFTEMNRSLPGLPRANPHVHAMVAYGYVVSDDGLTQAVRYRTSWGSGESLAVWDAELWEAGLPLRGVITYRPEPKITKVERTNGQVRMEWHGPTSVMLNELDGSTRPLNRYVVERADTLSGGAFVAVTETTPLLHSSFPDAGGERAFFRVRLQE